jgi:hypothetical protein
MGRFDGPQMDGMNADECDGTQMTLMVMISADA